MCALPIATDTPQQTASLFDHLVGAGEQRPRNGQAKRQRATRLGQPASELIMSAQKARLSALTTLRFIAASGIVIHHLRGPLLPNDALAAWPLGNAVSFFFVLSGFILAYTYPKLERPGAVRDFFIARVARIWPVHLATALFVLLTAATSTSPMVAAANLLLVHAWLPVSKFFFSLNAPSWTISTELFFYLVFPLLIFDFARSWWWKLGLSLVASMVMVAFAIGYAAPPFAAVNWSMDGLVYINPVARLFEFVVGMCLALAFAAAHSDRPKLSAGVATAIELAAILFFAANASLVSTAARLANEALGSAFAQWVADGASLLPGTVSLIFAMALQRGHISKLLGCRLGVFLGEISYSIYMLHTILLRGFAAHQSIFNGIPIPVLIAAYLLAVISLSAAMWVMLERPARRLIRSHLEGSSHLAPV
jgi:peptidoglycan/LPS O-acetylase OafA/YrhL